MTIDLTSPAQLKDLLNRHGFHARKRFGQNFLVDRNIVNRVLDASDIRPGDAVIEIGPGAGTLTEGIAERGAKVLAIEIDRKLVPVLDEVTASHPNIEIVNADFLGLDLPGFLEERFDGERVKVIGNLPYYVTSPIIARIIESREQIERSILMVQREVADRLQASPGSRDYGSMSIFVQFHAEVETVAHVSRNVFLPPPDVSSAIVRLTPRMRPAVEVPSETAFFDVVHCAFGKRRKTLLNSLSDCPALGLSKEEVARLLNEAGIDPALRAERLSLEDFATIARAL